MSAKIAKIQKGSLAEKAGLKTGDIIVLINDIEIIDYLDYAFATASENVTITTQNATFEILNTDFEPLGIIFETLLIDKPKSCKNKCIFCFIDQLPRGMRETCYFKDDDYRLSFLQGNYVSMTNMTDSDIDRIIKYNIPRINVSIHTTNPTLRQKMLNNKNADKIMDYLKRLADGCVNINAQIVLCPDFNDKAELDNTIKGIVSLGNSVESVSIVPVGLSDHRNGLTEIKPFTKDSAISVIEQVKKWQTKLKKDLGINLFYLADEFYLTADMPLPDYDEYDGFPQIENGVGLCSSLIYEFSDALSNTKRRKPKHKKTVATGVLAQPIIADLANKLDGNLINVIPITNNYFGNKITVSGLLTGTDIINQLKGKELGKFLLLPASLLRRNEDVLLDNITIPQIEKALSVKIKIVENDGYELLDAFLL